MDTDKLKERLRKMKALANFGSGGERDAAERLIRVLHGKRKANTRLARGLKRMGVQVEGV